MWGTAAGTATSITGGAGDETFNVAAAAASLGFAGPSEWPLGGLPVALAGPLSLDGGAGTNTLNVDDSADSIGRTVSMAPGSIGGLGGPITYAHLATLGVLLGSGNDTVSIQSPDAAVVTTLDGGLGANSVAVVIPGSYQGGLTLDRFATGSVAVGGDLAAPLPITGGLTSVTVSGALVGPLTLTAGLGALTVNGAMTGAVSAGDDISHIAIGGDFGGTISAGGAIGPTAVGGSWLGTLTSGQSVGTVIVNGNLTGRLIGRRYRSDLNRRQPRRDDHRGRLDRRAYRGS